MIVASSSAVAALKGRWCRIETAFTTFQIKYDPCIRVSLYRQTLECPMISPVEDPESNMKAWPNLAVNNEIQHKYLKISSHELLSTVTNGDDPFTLTIPFQIISKQAVN
jgi:hypothetical protein